MPIRVVVGFNPPSIDSAHRYYWLKHGYPYTPGAESAGCGQHPIHDIRLSQRGKNILVKIVC